MPTYCVAATIQLHEGREVHMGGIGSATSQPSSSTCASPYARPAARRVHGPLDEAASVTKAASSMNAARHAEFRIRPGRHDVAHHADRHAPPAPAAVAEAPAQGWRPDAEVHERRTHAGGSATPRRVGSDHVGHARRRWRDVSHQCVDEGPWHAWMKRLSNAIVEAGLPEDRCRRRFRGKISSSAGKVSRRCCGVSLQKRCHLALAPAGPGVRPPTKSVAG